MAAIKISIDFRNTMAAQEIKKELEFLYSELGRSGRSNSNIINTIFTLETELVRRKITGICSEADLNRYHLESGNSLIR